MKFLLLVLIAVAIIFALVLLAKAGSRVLDSSKQRKEARVEHEKTVAQLNVAEKYLRVIAQGAGIPEFEASEALDIMNSIRYPQTKELS